MKLAPYNRNAFGTHFGGSLYSMCDPFFALILIEQCGPGYAVWDKTSAIDFLRPGRGTVSATFQIPHHQVAEIKRLADTGQVVEPVFEVDVVDESGAVVARVTKTLHVRNTTQGHVERGAR
jgi:acyl-coenzyme A thioesterase PaaI-like protein